MKTRTVKITDEDKNSGTTQYDVVTPLWNDSVTAIRNKHNLDEAKFESDIIDIYLTVQKYNLKFDFDYKNEFFILKKVDTTSKIDDYLK